MLFALARDKGGDTETLEQGYHLDVYGITFDVPADKAIFPGGKLFADSWRILLPRKNLRK